MKIGYLGCGTWGTALATTLVHNKHEVKAWDCNEELLKILDKQRRHPKLKDFIVPQEIQYVSTIEEALEDVDLIVESVTSGGIRFVLEQIKKIKKPVPVVITSKGIEQKTQLLFPEIAFEILGEDSKKYIACLSGPSHAEEVIKKMPTTLVGASYDEGVRKLIVDVFNGEYFRIYPNRDVLGVAFGGAMKNVIAIACAISDGFGFGMNTKAALLTRGLHEMRKLCLVKGCDPNTLNGLSGLGDLFVTCASTLSRNYQFGCLIAKGYDIDKAKEEIGMVVEGAYSCVSAHELAFKNKIPTPISDTVYEILYKNLSPHQAVRALFQRKIKEEFL